MVSRHASPRDAEHDALWEDFLARLHELTEDPRYAPILLMEGTA